MTTSDIPFISSLESKGKNDANLESGDRGDRTEEGDVVKSHVELKFYSQGCGRHGSSVVLLRDSLLISGVVSGVYSYPLSHLTETFASSNSISDSLTSKLDINTERKGNTSIPAESDAVNAVSHKNGIRILKKSSLVTALVTSIGVCVDNPVSQKSKNDTGNCAIDTGIKDIIITGSSDKFITIITNNLPSAQPINIKQTTLHTEITISDIRLSGHTAALVALAVHSKTNYTTKQCTSITCRPSHLVSADSNHELLVWNLDKIISSSLLETPSAVGTKAEICEDRNPEQRISIFPHHAMTMALDFLPNSDVSALFVGGTDMKLSIFTYTSPVNPSGGSSRPNETSHLKQHTTDGVKDDSSNRTYQKILVVSGHMDWIRSIAISTFSAEGNLGGSSYLLSDIRFIVILILEVEKGWIQGDLMIATGSQDKYIRLYRISSDTSLLMQTHEISKGFDKSHSRSNRLRREPIFQPLYKIPPSSYAINTSLPFTALRLAWTRSMGNLTRLFFSSQPASFHIFRRHCSRMETKGGYMDRNEDGWRYRILFRSVLERIRSCWRPWREYSPMGRGRKLEGPSWFIWTYR